VVDALDQTVTDLTAPGAENDDEKPKDGKDEQLRKSMAVMLDGVRTMLDHQEAA